MVSGSIEPGLDDGQDPAAARFWRLAGRANRVAFGAALLLLLAAAFTGRPALATAAALCLAAGCLSNASSAAWRASRTWRTGAWIGLGRVRHTRVRRPGGFMLRMALHAFSILVWLGVAVYMLAWTLMAHLALTPGG